MIEITLFRAKTRESPFAAADTVLKLYDRISCVDFNGRVVWGSPGSCESGISTSRQGGKACRPTVVTVARQLIVPQQPLPACFSWPSDESGAHPRRLRRFPCPSSLRIRMRAASCVPLSVFFGNSSSRRLYLRLSAVSVWPGLSPFARPSRGAPSSDCAFLLTNAAVNRRSSLAVPFFRASHSALHEAALRRRFVLSMTTSEVSCGHCLLPQAVRREPRRSCGFRSPRVERLPCSRDSSHRRIGSRLIRKAFMRLKL